MSNILILNGAQPYPFAPGRLNATLAVRAKDRLEAQGHAVRLTTVAEGYDVEAEVENHRWADTVIMQFPVNWMGVPWSFKKYMDEVYTVGMDGRLTVGDGRIAEAPKANYGMGGALAGTRYMLSATLNAPAEAFDDPAEPFFAGLSLDDLLRPAHLNAKFFGMSPLPTFGAFDVMKNPEIESDLARFDAHLAAVFPDARTEAAA
ncbi:NAD(P)H-dependent oxidoreductase [Stappia taiwanensis]|uniref:NAD(P)H-dependent oxidoreductase n=1 Tax=Stappia taiwanensis TaxID=992267 RepID=A0A838Y3P0_9HYPH|nr:NAD(P)H-dependent oxidoreductase [Stappia taiwanensis]MBA4613583.1 NAD(P)H-dependent oxidoreductase [Stappia taiwanensis]GGE99008.1 flavodoxin [Stappia taiwanensis]